jgi:anti-sigma B factor antagonist
MQTSTVPNDVPGRLAIDGELTIFTVSQWKPRLLESILASPALELDLSAVSEIDSAGQQLLIGAQLHARALGRTLRLSACSAAVTELLALCWLAGWFGLAQGESA